MLTLFAFLQCSWVRAVITLMGIVAIERLALAQGTLDQLYYPCSTSMGSPVKGALKNEVAQTFICGKSGPLTRVDILGALSIPTGNLFAEIRSTDATGAPDAGVAPIGVLASTSVPGASVPTVLSFITMTFAAPATVVAGQRYALVLRADGTLEYGWNGGDVPMPDPYTGGGVYVRQFAMPWNNILSTHDFGFRTYIGNAPYPAAPPCGVASTPGKPFSVGGVGGGSEGSYTGSSGPSGGEGGFGFGFGIPSGPKASCILKGPFARVECVEASVLNVPERSRDQTLAPQVADQTLDLSVFVALALTIAAAIGLVALWSKNLF